MEASRIDSGGALRAGARLGEYEVIERIAVGGMAEIYLARVHSGRHEGRIVVLKRVPPQHVHCRDFVTMFLDEARLAAGLHHPNIARVYSLGADPLSYFFAMEYVAGKDVRHLQKLAWTEQRPLPLPLVIAIMLGVCEGLHAAHETSDETGTPLNVVHRDLSPSNILVSWAGEVKVIDFGVAFADRRLTETRTGIVKGKCAYMSPEQCRGTGKLDRRSDIFAAGTVLYELTCGRRLFAASSEYQTMRKILRERICPPRQFVASYPAELEAIVMRALERQPERRQGSALELHQELAAFAARHRLDVSRSAVRQHLRTLFPGEAPADQPPRRAAGGGGSRPRRRAAAAATPATPPRTPGVDSLVATIDRSAPPAVPHAGRGARPGTAGNWCGQRRSPREASGAARDAALECPGPPLRAAGPAASTASPRPASAASPRSATPAPRPSLRHLGPGRTASNGLAVALACMSGPARAPGGPDARPRPAALTGRPMPPPAAVAAATPAPRHRPAAVVESRPPRALRIDRDVDRDPGQQPARRPAVVVESRPPRALRVGQKLERGADRDAARATPSHAPLPAAELAPDVAPRRAQPLRRRGRGGAGTIRYTALATAAALLLLTAWLASMTLHGTAQVAPAQVAPAQVAPALPPRPAAARAPLAGQEPGPVAPVAPLPAPHPRRTG